jgi:antitoxin component YwqK of YwqJK toxin-antitoxin module
MKKLTTISLLFFFCLSNAQNSDRMQITYSTVQHYNYELDKYEKALAKQSIVSLDFDNKIYITDTIDYSQIIFYIIDKHLEDLSFLYNCYDSTNNSSCWIHLFEEDSFYVCEVECINKYKFKCLLSKNKQSPIFTSLRPANNYNGDWQVIANDIIISKVKYKNGLRNGKTITYYDNGRIQGIYGYKNDLLRGAFKVFFENGLLKRKGNFFNNELNGTVINFNESKEIILSENYKKGKRDGVYKKYYNNQKLEIKDCFKNDIRNGLYLEYYENGNIKTNYNFKDGLLEGLCNSYFYNGNKLDESNFLKGLMDGRYTKFYENGNIQFTGIYKDTILNGDYKAFYENGQLFVSNTYVNGIVIGPYFSYNEFGNPFISGDYLNDCFSGQKINYYENNNIKQINNYRNDTLNGDYIINYENGNLMESGNYKLGKKDGIIKCYYSNGAIKSESFFNLMNGYNNKITYNIGGHIDRKFNFYLNYYNENQKFDSTSMTFVTPVKMNSIQMIIDTTYQQIFLGDSINNDTYTKFFIKSFVKSDTVSKFIAVSERTNKTFEINYYENKNYYFMEINYTEKQRNLYLSKKSN